MNDIAQHHADAFGSVASRMAELLEPFEPLARVRPRRPEDPDVLALAGVSRHGLYRLLASKAIACERGKAPTRRDGRRGAARIFLTLVDVAAYRAARFVPINDEAPVLPGAGRKTNAHRETITLARQVR